MCLIRELIILVVMVAGGEHLHANGHFPLETVTHKVISIFGGVSGGIADGTCMLRGETVQFII